MKKSVNLQRPRNKDLFMSLRNTKPGKHQNRESRQQSKITLRREI